MAEKEIKLIEWYQTDFTMFENCPWENCKFCDKERQNKCEIIRNNAIENGRFSTSKKES
jgi:hypothetical protein